MNAIVEPLPGTERVNEAGHAGYILVFNPAGLGHVSYESVVRGLAQYGFPLDKAVKTTPRQAFRRWLNQMKARRAIDQLPREKGDSIPNEVVVFQFTKRALEAGKFSYAYELKIFLNTDTGRVICPSNEALGQYAQEIVANYMEEKAADYINTLVKSLVDDATTMNAMNLSPRAYSFPSDQSDLVDRLYGFLRLLGVQTRVFSLAHDDRTENSLAEVALEKAGKLMDGLDDRVDKWDEDTTNKALLNQAERFSKAKREVEAHAALFKSLYHEMCERIEKSSRRMLEKAKRCGIVSG